MVPGLIFTLKKIITKLLWKSKNSKKEGKDERSILYDTYSLIFNWLRTALAFTMITYPQGIWFCYLKEYTVKGNFT